MKVLGAILAGGGSTRFGSDKAIALFHGRSLLEHAASCLSLQCDAIVVVGRTHASLPCAEDLPAPGMGPLGGIAGAIAFAQSSGFDHVLSIGVDTLDIPADLRGQLVPAPAYVIKQPVIGLWPVSAGQLLAQILGSNDRHSMRHFAESLGARAVTLANEPANINTQSDLAELEARK